MDVDLLLDPFGARWNDMRTAAQLAEELGYGGIWTWDHLAGQAHGADGVLECWTILSSLAAVTERVMLGPLVLNVANRRPGLLATMAATLQEVSDGRLLLGIGAGGGEGTPYPPEQTALGGEVPSNPVRRRQLEETVQVIRQVWTGAVEPWEGEQFHLGRAHGFLRPDPPPPVIVGGFGPRTLELAGRIGDGLNTQARHPRLAELVDVARRAHADAGGDAEAFLVTVFANFDPRWATPGHEEHDRLQAVGVDRLILQLSPPYDHTAMTELARQLPPHDPR
ncbi:LLM class flavin-dependent oxidoreductase [Rhabdothermincola salaria]|uniref:LLM class flavin-dependent oxidoreductase n=1 Tax=Rhabdothermincola salaria TaxID=2903142 RepID=UPI001E61BCD6|nr:LLM class flavin-dependent oxidoreductase [Rhabdothermincola salaria]MCD9625714.1 LLM class flavin-dependent oxidoreductase [Rhabdothermincola salaria]